MTETKKGAIPTFEEGDVIRIEIEASDSSGVASMEARFTLEDPQALNSFVRSVDLGGKTEVHEFVEFEVNEDFIPGEYVCEYITLTDTLGNKSLFTKPGIRFRVAGEMKDRKGPELRRLDFVSA